MIDKLIDVLTEAFRNQSWLVAYGTTYRIAEDVLAILDKDAAELVNCRDCQSHEPCEVRNRVWCKTMGRYMKEEGFCSEGKMEDNG